MSNYPLILDEVFNNLHYIRYSKVIFSEINFAADLCSETIKNKKMIYLFGNGGSASDAQHIAAEFIGKLNKPRGPLPAISLTSDTSVLTAISNDYGYTELFSRQLKALGQSGDTAIAFSTSGKSPNILEGLWRAKCSKKMNTILFTGTEGIPEETKSYCDIVIKCPGDNSSRIQEIHIILGHILVSMVESKLDIK